MSFCHFIRIILGSPSPSSSLVGLHTGLRCRPQKKEKQLWMWTTLWWLPPDAILDLNFTSDPHVNELSIHRVCVLQAVWIWNVPLFIWVSKLCVLDIDSPCCDPQCQHWAGRWNLWLLEASGRVSNAINPAPEEISARLLCLMQLWFKQWWCLFRRWSISASWVAKVNYSHHTVLHSSTLAKNFLTSVKIQFMPILNTPMLVNMCSANNISLLGKNFLPAVIGGSITQAMRQCCSSCTSAVSARGKWCLWCWVTKLFHVLASS